ncbi:uncharacterized protein EI97DRAFT_398853, partial [Westerdykella ornata]
METVTKDDLARLVNASKNALIEALTSATASPTTIGIYRMKSEIMVEQWTKYPQQIMNQFGGTGPIGWKMQRLLDWDQAASDLATEIVAYEQSSTQRFSRYLDKGIKYANYVSKVASQFDDFFYAYKDVYTGITTIYEANLETPKYTKVLKDAFMEWYDQHVMNDRFLRKSAREGMVEFLRERPDMILLLNFIHALPKLKSEIQEDIARPLAVEAMELSLSLVPLLGNAIALYEIWSGRDLFGYHLSDLERGIMAASVLLPMAGRLVKGGRALYTEARLVKLYGRDAAGWNRAIRSSARAAEQRSSLRAIKSAEDSLRVSGKLEGAVAKEAAIAVPKLLHSPGNLAASVSNEVKILWEAMSKKYAALKGLDEIALRRVLEKGPNVDHLKGQLLEELAEAHVIPMLRNRQGGFALGVKVPAGKTLEYVPGHAIRTASGRAGRQVTDGMVGYWDKEVFNIVAIFEAKSGRKGARELSLKTTDIAKLGKTERDELRAFAKEVWAEEKEIAEEAGKSYTRTVEEVEKEVILDEAGGQIRRDIERLDELGDGTLAQIRIGSNVHPVKLSATKTKFFGIVPKGVRISLLEKEVRAEGFLFEAIAVPVHTKELQKIAEEMVQLAERLVQK